jgi:hypothetical protein
MYIHFFEGVIMSKSKTRGKDKKKGAQLVLRVEKTERDAFVALCERLDTTAAREIRRFMRDMVAAHVEAPDASDAEEPAVPAPEAADETLNKAQPEVAAAKGRKKAAEAPIAALPDEGLAAVAEDAAETDAPKRRKKMTA